MVVVVCQVHTKVLMREAIAMKQCASGKRNVAVPSGAVYAVLGTV